MRNLLRRSAILGATISSITAVLGLIGYIPGFGVLGSIQEEFIPMAPSTAISFLILNLFILLLPRIDWQRRNTIIGCFLALIVSLFGILETFDAFLGTDLNLENLLFPSGGTLGSIPIARMSPSTGAVFFIAGLTTFLLIFFRFKKKNSPRLMNIASILGTLTMLIALLFLLAYIYGTPLLYDQGSLVPMALTTAFGFLMLGGGLFASSDKTSIPLRYIAQSNTYAQLLRIFFPLSIIAVLTGSFIMLFIHFFSFVNAAFIAAIIMVLVAVLTGLVVNWASKIIGESIDEEKTKRKNAEVSLHEALNQTILYKDIFAHDINNILQSMLLGIQACELTNDETSDLRDNINIMKAQVLRGSNLVSNIHNLSKLEENEIPLRKRDICKVLKNSIASVKPMDQERNLNIQFDFNDKELFILGNDLLEHVFDNILNNAIRHNKNPTIEIKIKISKQERKRVNYLKVEFLDNGRGVSDTRKDIIFNRGNREIKSVHGMGLGLSLVKKIIETYNGEIWVEDRVKGDHRNGSNFILLIPEVN